MLINKQRRRLLWVVIVLIALLPGFPVLLALGAIACGVAGIGHLVFAPALLLFNLYYRLPVMIFGSSLFQSTEFGLRPTAGGYVVAAVLYGLITVVLFLPIYWLFSRNSRRDYSSNDRLSR